MVIQRTIENLRERPKDQRRAVALGVSFVFTIILFVGWAVFFSSQVTGDAALTQTSQVYTDTIQGASDVYSQSAVQSASAAQAVPSSAATPDPSANMIQINPESSTSVVGQ